MTHVPGAPAALLGVANLRGAVLPVLCAARLLGGAPAGTPSARVAVVTTPEGRLGLLVDDVGGLASQSDESVLDLPALLAARFAFTRRAAPRQVASAEAALPTTSAETTALLVFALAGQEYALPLTAVAEIVAVPAEIAAVPGQDAVMLGLAAWRGGALPLISLRALLGLAAMVPDRRTARVLVARLGGAAAGLVVDTVRDIARLPPEAFDPVPPVLTRARGEARVAGIARGAGGARLISVLALTALFDAATTARLAALGSDTAAPLVAARGDLQRFVVFRLGDDQFGVPVGAVDQVVSLPATLSPVPRAPAMLLGVMNVRGQALPVIDPARCFGTDGATGGGLVVVLRVEGARTGLAVTAVTALLTVAAAELRPLPPLSVGRDGVFDRVAEWERDGRMILIIDPRTLVALARRDLAASS